MGLETPWKGPTLEEGEEERAAETTCDELVPFPTPSMTLVGRRERIQE